MADKPSLANGLQLQGCLVPISMTRSVPKLLWLMSILNNCRTCIAEFSRAHAAFNAQCTMAHQRVVSTITLANLHFAAIVTNTPKGSKLCSQLSWT